MEFRMTGGFFIDTKFCGYLVIFVGNVFNRALF
jgi:hypothetical protein